MNKFRVESVISTIQGRTACLARMLLLVTMFLSAVAFAQQQPTDTSGGPNIADDSLRDAYIVLGTTTIGAVLGLSTLSFVEEPGRHLKNVVVGGALGIIVGVGVVAYMQANKSRDMYMEGAGEEAPAGASNTKLDLSSPLANASEYYEKKSGLKQIPFFNFTYTF